jgi:hypothetical protein
LEKLDEVPAELRFETGSTIHDGALRLGISDFVRYQARCLDSEGANLKPRQTPVLPRSLPAEAEGTL